MKLRHLVVLWLIITVIMSYEYLVFHRQLSSPSILQTLLCGHMQLCKRINPTAGHSLSYALGWLGFSVMALTNIYILRKRLLFMQKMGNLQGWLNWHIFFGLLGPTLIVFHSNFKVGGLVSISFWSMVISFLSGIAGRYIYIQLLQGKQQLKKDIDSYEKIFERYLRGKQIPDQVMVAAKAHAFALAGGLQGDDLKRLGIFEFLGRSLMGELRLWVQLPPVPWRESKQFRRQLKHWALLRRRLISMHYYQLLFGYWRSFHTPFAIWMYIVAVIHIISSLIFKVN